MQTFLPYPGFMHSAQYLDRQRLGKQRIEAKQIYLALTNPDYGWQNHPAVKMWRGHEQALLTYGATICIEWRYRGYLDNQLEYFMGHRTKGPVLYPDWLGDENFHASHRSNLLRKDPEWYGQFGWTEPNDSPYIWPEV